MKFHSRINEVLEGHEGLKKEREQVKLGNEDGVTAAFYISGWFQEEIKKVSSLVRRSTLQMTYKDKEKIL